MSNNDVWKGDIMKRLGLICSMILLLSISVDAKELEVSVGYKFSSLKDKNPIVTLRGEIDENYYYELTSGVYKGSTGEVLVGAEPSIINNNINDIANYRFLAGFKYQDRIQNFEFVLKNRIYNVIFDSDFGLNAEIDINYAPFYNKPAFESKLLLY